MYRADHSSREILPTKLGVSEYDREASTTKRLRSTGDCWAITKLFPSYYIHGIGLLEINSRLKSGNAYYQSVQNLLSSSSIYNYLTLRRLMSYIYGAPILDVSRSHTTTQHSR